MMNDVARKKGQKRILRVVDVFVLRLSGRAGAFAILSSRYDSSLATTLTSQRLGHLRLREAGNMNIATETL